MQQALTGVKDNLNYKETGFFICLRYDVAQNFKSFSVNYIGWTQDRSHTTVMLNQAN